MLFVVLDNVQRYHYILVHFGVKPTLRWALNADKLWISLFCINPYYVIAWMLLINCIVDLIIDQYSYVIFD